MSADGRGVDKGFLQYRDRPLIEHVLERLRPQVCQVILSAPDNPRWKALGNPLVQDRLGDSLGPLAGIHAGMLAAPSQWLLCVPCDAPLLPTDLAGRLLATQKATGARCVSVSAGARLHPVFALIDVTLGGPLEQYLISGGRTVQDWFETIDAVYCEFPDAAAFANINTPPDLSKLEHS